MRKIRLGPIVAKQRDLHPLRTRCRALTARGQGNGHVARTQTPMRIIHTRGRAEEYFVRDRIECRRVNPMTPYLVLPQAFERMSKFLCNIRMSG